MNALQTWYLVAIVPPVGCWFLSYQLGWKYTPLWVRFVYAVCPKVLGMTLLEHLWLAAIQVLLE